MFSINLNNAEPTWYNWPVDAPKEKQAKLLIRPYPASQSELKMRRTSNTEDGDNFNMEIVKEGSENKRIFIYCLMEAKDLTDKEGNPLELDKKIIMPGGDGKVKMTVKEFIFDYCFESGMPNFVLSKAKAAEAEIEEEKKTCGSGESISS